MELVICISVRHHSILHEKLAVLQSVPSIRDLHFSFHFQLFSSCDMFVWICSSFYHLPVLGWLRYAGCSMNSVSESRNGWVAVSRMLTTLSSISFFWDSAVHRLYNLHSVLLPQQICSLHQTSVLSQMVGISRLWHSLVDLHSRSIVLMFGVNLTLSNSLYSLVNVGELWMYIASNTAHILVVLGSVVFKYAPTHFILHLQIMT